MNRPVEFRLWARGFTKIMYEVEKSFRLGEIHLLFVDPILMQFTGLLDSNGKKIFEGDILRKDTDFGGVIPGVYNIIFDRYKFRLCGHRVYRGIGSIANNPQRWKLIGNIYENPEMKL